MAKHRYQVFLSHSSVDKPAVEDLANRLMREGIEPWLDKWNLVPGEVCQPAMGPRWPTAPPAPCSSAPAGSAPGRTRRCRWPSPAA